MPPLSVASAPAWRKTVTRTLEWVIGLFLLALIVEFAIACTNTAGNRDQDLRNIERYADPAFLRDQVANRPPWNGTNQADWVLVDVRSNQEFAQGHIPDALNVPLDQLKLLVDTWDRHRIVVVYCRSGNRSAQAKTILEAKGFGEVVDFGALSRWTGDVVAP